MNAIHLNYRGHGSQPISSVNTDPAVTPKRYSATAIALHWVLGVVIVAVFGVGLYMANLPFSPLRLKLYNWHKWTGMTLLALSMFRLVWRVTHRPPALPRHIADAMPTWQHHVHHATHTGTTAFDKHLQSDSFFNSAAFPNAKFIANNFSFSGEKVSEVTGQLTLLGKTNPVVLKATNFNCYNNPMLKREVCGGDFETTIVRSQWDMGWGVNLGIPDSVKLAVQVEAVKQ